MNKKSKTEVNRLVNMAYDAKTQEHIKEVLNSEEFKKASGLEAVHASAILGFTMVRIRLDCIDDKLDELIEAIKPTGGKR